jgi:DNA repair exonuclease SbcCD ATPase subunit
MLTEIEKQVVNGRKEYVGEAVILNTSKGKDLQEIIRAGGRVGVSSRGWGSLVRGNWQGRTADIVQEDFTLKTFDFVIGQSTKDAEVTQFFEQMDVVNILDTDESPEENTKGGKKVMEIKTVDDLKKAYPELCEQLVKEALAEKEKEIKESLEKDFEDRVMKEVEAKREEIKEEVIKEIKNSEEIQTMMATLIEIGKLVKPYISEAKGDEEDEEDEEEVDRLKARISELEAELKALRKAKQEAEEKEKVAKKIQEVTAGKKFEKLLVERLSNCQTVEEVEKRLAEEEAYIQKLMGEVGAGDLPKGKGQVLDENKQDEMDEMKRRQRILAGVEEDIAKQKRASA